MVRLRIAIACSLLALVTAGRRRYEHPAAPDQSQACSEAPVVNRLTTSEDKQRPNPKLSLDSSPIQYGGINFETKLPRAALMLTKPTWPRYTLLHNSSFELNLNDLDNHLIVNEQHLHLTALDHAEAADVIMIVVRFKDGTLFPDSNGLQNGILPPGTLCVVRSALLKAAAQRAMIGDRRDPECKCIRSIGRSTIATMQDVLSIVIWKARMKVIDTPIAFPVGDAPRDQGVESTQSSTGRAPLPSAVSPAALETVDRILGIAGDATRAQGVESTESSTGTAPQAQQDQHEHDNSADEGADWIFAVAGESLRSGADGHVVGARGYRIAV